MSEAQPIILKKKKVSGGDGHHGGAWKVAYADFVTAMMAFFLLMWLLNATSEEQRKGLADYFDPALPISRASAGGAGMLSGDTIFAPPSASGSREEGERPRPTASEAGADLGELSASPDQPEDAEAPDTAPPLRVEDDAQEISQTSPPQTTPGQTEADGQSEANAMAALEEEILGNIRAAGESGLLDHFSMRMTPEGLVIELTDITNEPLFRSGAPAPEPILETLIDILVPVLERTTNDIAVAGHTDSTPFVNRTDYSNWELSSERANAARRLLADSGLSEERIVRVSGRAATDPIAADPRAPQNRRIGITLLRNGINRPNSGQ